MRRTEYAVQRPSMLSSPHFAPLLAVWESFKAKAEGLACIVERQENSGLISGVLIALICFVVAIISHHYVTFVKLGCVLTIIPCGCVILSYFLLKQFRQHPNSILYWKAVCEIIFSAHLMYSFRDDGGAGQYFSSETGDQLKDCRDIPSDPTSRDCEGCAIHAAITQFTLIASDSWFGCLSYDLHTSISNPFSSFKSNMRKYHVLVWTIATVTTVILLVTRTYGHANVNICWIKRTKAALLHVWLLYYIWVIGYASIGVTVMLESRRILKKGLASTYATRSEVIFANQRSVGVIMFYWAVIIFIYLVFLFPDTDGSTLTRKNPIQKLLVFIFAARGILTAGLWFWANPWNKFIAHLLRHGLFVERLDGDFEEKYRPQVNVALRKEMLYFISQGIKQSIERNMVEPLAPDQSNREFLLSEEVSMAVPGDDSTLRTLPSHVSVVERGDGTRSTKNEERPHVGLGSELGRSIMDKPASQHRESSIFSMFTRFSSSHVPSTVQFIDYYPGLFATIRHAFGVEDVQYMTSLTQSTREKLNEGGASGAFMFYSKDRKFLIKSTTKSELKVLISIIGAYTSYILKYPKSLMTRFYGCHSVTLYGQEFPFVVMANIFHTNKVVNFKYDVKGSWVNRNAKPVVYGRRVLCRHCNTRFVYGNQSICPERVGGHEPNVILKDNDLTHKMKLGDQKRKEVLTSLKMDSEFLRDLGIMDYSLIIGITTEEFDINSNDGAFQSRAMEEKSDDISAHDVLQLTDESKTQRAHSQATTISAAGANSSNKSEVSSRKRTLRPTMHSAGMNANRNSDGVIDADRGQINSSIELSDTRR